MNKLYTLIKSVLKTKEKSEKSEKSDKSEFKQTNPLFIEPSTRSLLEHYDFIDDALYRNKKTLH